jgi:formylglycine-generating enzyme required for sulfatase activity
MGDDKGNPDVRPAHKVKITKPFYLGKYEVTQEQWLAMVGDDASRFKRPKNPLAQVTWDDCQKFIDNLNGMLDTQGGRFALPTEAQWEYACRAGSDKDFCFGDDKSRLGDYAWCYGNSGGKTHPVGEKKANAFGLYDMHGNVGEWCHDYHNAGYYGKSPADDPTGPTAGTNRVARGGSFENDGGLCRSPFRVGFRPGFRQNSLGLRVALVPAE